MELATRYARENGLILDSRSFADLGVSAFRGANLRTGKLGEFLIAVEQGAIPKGSYLLMESLDRMSRADPWDAVGELRKIVKAGIKVVTLVNSRIYEVQEGNIDFTLLEAVVVLTRAHEESAIKSRRLKAAWEKKRADADIKPITSVAPAWLNREGTNGGFKLIPARAQVVRDIFQAFLDGEGTHSIAHRLNGNAVKPFGKATFWHRSYVLKILDNPATMGQFTPHTLDYEDGIRSRNPKDPIANYYPAVIDTETFARVKALRSAKRSPSQTPGTRKVSHLLAGLARCPLCLSSMIRVNKGGGRKAGYPYLVCSRAKAGAGCEYHGVRIDRIEPKIIACHEELARRMPKGSETLEDVGKLLAKEREELSKKIERFVAFLEGGPSEAVRSELANAERELARVRREEQELEVIQASRTVISRRSRLNDLRLALKKDPIDYAYANAALRQLFSRVDVHWDMAALDFHWQHGGKTRVRVANESW